jgi:hypothetical protein
MYCIVGSGKRIPPEAIRSKKKVGFILRIWDPEFGMRNFRISFVLC